VRTLPPLLALTLASAAIAQSWEFTFSNQILSPKNPSTTITLSATFAPTDWAFAGARLDLHSSEPGWSDIETLSVHPGQRAGELQPGGRTVAGISVGQLYGFGFTPDPDNPIAMWRGTFEVTDFAPRDVTLATSTERFDVYPEDLGPLPPFEPRTPIDVEAAIRVIPAPGPLARLGLAVLATARRRRPQ
jgi:hypothetical protein